MSVYALLLTRKHLRTNTIYPCGVFVDSSKIDSPPEATVATLVHTKEEKANEWRRLFIEKFPEYSNETAWEFDQQNVSLY